MKLLLNPQYALRGWLKMPRVLFNLKENRAIKNLTLEQFWALQSCDGEQDLKISSVLQEFLGEGIISQNDKSKKLSEDQKYYCFSNRYFNSARWGITGRCNYKCKHCFMAAGSENNNCELSREKCLDIVDQLADCGVEEVILTGGEPLLRPDFFDIVDELLKRNIKLNAINTNGSLITENFINEIKKRNINPAFSVSFDGIGCHNWMRGTDNAEKEAINATKLLANAGFYVISVFCLHSGNVNVLIDTIEFMKDLGVSRVEVYRTGETLRWNLQKEYKSLPYETCYDIYLDLIYKHRDRNWKIDMYLKDFCRIDKNSNIYDITPLKGNENTKAEKTVVCCSNRAMFFIAPNGEVLPCNAFTGYSLKNELNFENLNDTKLKDILTKSKYLNCVLATVKDIFDRNEECRTCRYNKKCMGGHCRFIALAGTGDYFGKDESTCAFFRGNYDQKIIDFIESK